MSTATMTTPATKTIDKPAEPNGKSLLDKILDADQRRLTNQLRETAGLYVEAIEHAANHLEKTLIISDGIRKLRGLLTDEVMDKFIMPLQNSPLGFLTDRDPSKGGKEPYGREVVRECAVATFLAGLRLVDNEVNIIAGRMMPVLNGWRRKVKELPGVTDAEVLTGTAGVEGSVAKIAISARAKLNGVPVELKNNEGKPGRTIHIPIKSAQYETVDTWRGKAERRAWKALFERLNGGVSSVMDQPEEDLTPAAEQKPAVPPTSKTDQLAASLGAKPPQPQALSPDNPTNDQADLDDQDRLAAISDLRARISTASEADLPNLSADLMRSRESFGEEVAVLIEKEIAARREAVKPAAPAPAAGKRKGNLY